MHHIFVESNVVANESMYQQQQPSNFVESNVVGWNQHVMYQQQQSNVIQPMYHNNNQLLMWL